VTIVDKRVIVIKGSLMTTILVLLTILLSSVDVLAITKYVDNTSTGCSNGSTTYNPSTKSCGAGSSTVYTTLYSGIDNIGAQNQLQIRGGTYSEVCAAGVLEGGVSGSPTIIEPYIGESVLWIKNIAGDSRDCLLSTSASWFTIRKGSGSSFIIDGNNDSNNTDQAILTGNGNSTNVTLDGIELRNGYKSCATGFSSGFTVINSIVHDCGLSGEYLWHGLYISGSNILIERSKFYNNAGYSIHCYSGTSNCDSSIIRYNLVYNSGIAVSPQSGGILVDGNDNTIYKNSVQCQSPASDFGITTYIEATNNKIYHNSVTDCGIGIHLQSGSSGAIVQNNVSFGNTTNINDSGTGDSIITNTTSDPLFNSKLTNNLSLLPGSPAINAGTQIVGYPVNIDNGAYQTLSFSTCEVIQSQPSVLRLLFINNSSSQILPTSGILGFTVREGFTNKSISSVSASGNTILVNMTTPFLINSQIDFSFNTSIGNPTDNILIGGFISQKLVQTLTNVSCSNNINTTDTLKPKAPTNIRIFN
jgi:hypothetical protein